MPELSEAKAREIAQILEKLCANPPKEVRDRMRARIEERRRGMSRGGVLIWRAEW